jgi:LacI family transcriptional regulator
MLRLPDPPPTFCCGNDRMAFMVYGILRTRGMKLPEEISVAGCGNYRAIAEILYPPLTTVDLPYAAIGISTAQRLLAIMAGEKDLQNGPTLVTGPVHWRGSVTEKRKTNMTQTETATKDN